MPYAQHVSLTWFATTDRCSSRAPFSLRLAQPFAEIAPGHPVLALRQRTDRGDLILRETGPVQPMEGAGGPGPG